MTACLHERRNVVKEREREREREREIENGLQPVESLPVNLYYLQGLVMLWIY